MKLRTSLQLSAIFPIVFAIVVISILQWRIESLTGSGTMDAILLAVLGLLGITMAAVIISYSRSLLSKLKVLNQWADAVLKGDLDHSIDIDSTDDEVGRLSHALSQMLRELKDAYATMQKESLDHKQQAVDHKRRADASQVGTRHLVDALARQKDAGEKVAQEERIRGLEQVVRGVTHDFSEALLPILGTADILMDNPDALERREDTLEHVRTIRSGVERAQKSLKNLAGFLQPGEYAVTPVDLNHVVEQTVARLESIWKDQSEQKGIVVKLRTNLEMVSSVAGQEADLEDLVACLILNATEALPDGGGITISVQGQGRCAVLEVRDTGQGMTEEVRRRCMEPFYSTKAGSGRGMGLTTVSGTVRRHKGTLNIDSSPGKGTRILINLPIWTETLAKTQTPKPESSVAQGLRVLVVDDDEWCRNVLVKLLVMRGFVAEKAETGPEGLQKMESGNFDVVIVDRAMPGMTGDELATAIKNRFPKMPVIMLSGFGGIMTSEGDIPKDIDVLMTKPVTVDAVTHGIAEAMAKASARPDKQQAARAPDTPPEDEVTWEG